MLTDTTTKDSQAMSNALGLSSPWRAMDGRHFSMFIDGRWTAAISGENIPVIDPSTGESFATCPNGSAHDVERAVHAARRSFDEGGWRRRPGSERAAVLLDVAARLRQRAADFALIETLQQGHLMADSELDVSLCASKFEYCAGLAADRQGQPLLFEAGLADAVTREPVGVVAAITPWNYPLAIAVEKLAPALAAGNSVIIKPASITPLTTVMLAEVLADAGVPAGVVNVVTGPGDDVGEALASSPLVDMVTLTGSVPVGQQVGATAAATIKRVVLELGGKSANVVFADCDFEAAIQGTMMAMFSNAGQVCTAGTRLIIERSIHDRFVDELVQRASRLRIGPAVEDDVEMGPLVSEQQLNTVADYVQAGIEDGAQLVCGGHRVDRPGYFFEPTVFTSVTAMMRIFREEIFGPVLAVTAFDSEDEAVALANDTEYGLAAGIWTSNLSRALRVSSELDAGHIWINTWYALLDNATGGGRKLSGVGVESGLAGFEEFTVVKHVALNMSDEPCGLYPAHD